MDSVRKVKVDKKILIANEEYACKNRDFLAKRKIPCLNVISSPGSGKTTILVRTIRELRGKIRIGVIEGDIQTDIDAQRIKTTGAPAIQINTDGACHLSAAQVSDVLQELPIDKLDLIFIENVGNLICPSVFDLGETAKIAVLSIPEGDDKPDKYPLIFATSATVLINKIDLLDGVDFDIKKVKTNILKLNKDARIFPVSAKTGVGILPWCKWLTELVNKTKNI